jgi:hypothetical protein
MHQNPTFPPGRRVRTMAINKISDSNYKTSFNYKVHNLHMSEDADLLEEKIVE